MIRYPAKPWPTLSSFSDDQSPVVYRRWTCIPIDPSFLLLNFDGIHDARQSITDRRNHKNWWTYVSYGARTGTPRQEVFVSNPLFHHTLVTKYLDFQSVKVRELDIAYKWRNWTMHAVLRHIDAVDESYVLPNQFVSWFAIISPFQIIGTPAAFRSLENLLIPCYFEIKLLIYANLYSFPNVGPAKCFYNHTQYQTSFYPKWTPS